MEEGEEGRVLIKLADQNGIHGVLILTREVAVGKPEHRAILIQHTKGMVDALHLRDVQHQGSNDIIVSYRILKYVSDVRPGFYAVRILEGIISGK